MQIGAYTIELISNGEHNVHVVETVLKHYFCPMVSVHFENNSLAVCEDQVFFVDGQMKFKNYENYIRSSHKNLAVVTIQEYNSSEFSNHMINNIVTTVMRDYNDAYMLNWY
ncbi:Hypothetical protein Trvi_ORF121 [Trabala vishnou gigantina nucleopolyhedrovirus]|uniref:Hypothetical protein n=1 Tax=Trabala vishnou gigantina nucleopolyhedrovirus TaxID=2863583 RepID=UPI002481DC49|nr:Hypothetical protein QKU87_gp121 [Trabala vishnou gigantina nucleopolyhedrovirus]QYC92771.1 Hypothetical protein Trvi_ORF121 [Trabala vishnou gigantina nucleopolyhedrovirus]